MSSLKRLGTVGKMFVPQQFKPSVDKEDINMAKGENIFKRKDGRWEARYIKGYELSGKIKYGFCYGKTYREAKEKVTKCKAALVSGKPVPSANSRRRFSFYCDEWLRLRKPKAKESTYIKYDTALIKHIKPKLGGCFPMGITTGLIDGFTEELLFEEELAPKTVMDTCKFGVLLALFTGVRIGELCALQWGKISLKEQMIRIDATLQRLRDTSAVGSARTRIVISTPKSDTSVRTIPVTDYTAELCGKMAPHSSAAYVLTGTDSFMEPRALQYRMEKYTRECGLEGVHFHTLRHTFATYALQSGADVKTLSCMLGHYSAGFTLNTYCHATRDMQADAARKIGGFMSAQTGIG